jgi:hypothetical protein
MKESEAKKIIKEAFEDIKDDDFYTIVPNGKDTKNLPESALIYGEFPVDSFPEILKLVNPQEGEVFYDLGSGIGKLLIFLGLTSKLSEVCGIEAIKEYFQIASKKIKILNKSFQSSKVSCIHGDFLKDDSWTKADIIFAYATCYTEEMMEKIAFMAEDLSAGSRFVSINMPLKADYLKLRLKDRFDFGFTARAEVFVYEKN